MTKLKRKNLLVILLIGFGVLLNLRISWIFSPTGGDFIQDYESAKSFLLGGSLYAAYPHPHPPLLVLLHLPFVLLPIEQSFLLFALVSLLAAWFFCRWTGEALNFGRERILLLFAIVLFWPEFHGVPGLGAVSAIVSMFVALFGCSLLREKDRTAGAALAVAAMLKVYPGFLLLVPIGLRRWKVVEGFVLAAVLVHLIMLPFIGFGAIREWFLIGAPFAAQFLDNPVNVSLPAYFEGLFGPIGGYRDPILELPAFNLLSRYLIPLSGLVVIYLTACRYRSRSHLHAGILGLSFSALLLTEAITWGHYLLLLAWPFAWIGFDEQRRLRAGGVYTLALILLCGFETATRFVSWQFILQLRNSSPLTEGLAPCIGMAILIWLVSRELSSETGSSDSGKSIAESSPQR